MHLIFDNIELKKHNRLHKKTKNNTKKKKKFNNIGWRLIGCLPAREDHTLPKQDKRATKMPKA
jgi:hypothetical protein